jgi:hypothetical protein
MAGEQYFASLPRFRASHYNKEGDLEIGAPREVLAPFGECLRESFNSWG